tara:strand:- start:1657 stop:2235 length:579 start_codon:yes stop_codon:yes gene_type:complete
MKVIFIHIPKSAGYAIARCLDEVNSLVEGYGYTHSSAKDIIKPSHYSLYPILAVVRNPYDRLYSLYNFYSQKRDVISPSISFKKFILNYPNKYYKTHFRYNNCYDFIQKDNQLITTDILFFENLSNDYNSFCKKYNIKNNLKVMNYNDKKIRKIDKSKLYTNEMRKIVEEIFKKDFKVFNYTYENFLEKTIL